jgi:hypothetical protein
MDRLDSEEDVSAIGLPMPEHVDPHLDDTGLCQCPCDECTTRLAKLCLCMDCRCDGPGGHLSDQEATWHSQVVGEYLKGYRDTTPTEEWKA